MSISTSQMKRRGKEFRAQPRRTVLLRAACSCSPDGLRCTLWPPPGPAEEGCDLGPKSTIRTQIAPLLSNFTSAVWHVTPENRGISFRKTKHEEFIDHDKCSLTGTLLEPPMSACPHQYDCCERQDCPSCQSPADFSELPSMMLQMTQML